MNIQKISRNSTDFTTRLFKNKTILKGLEHISEHGTTFSATTSLIMSSTVRVLAINSTPDTEKENKQYAMANSICSGLIKFAMVEAVALPIEKAVKNIDKNPQKYLKNFENFAGSKSYKLLTQIFKLGTGFITAVPKSILTIALIPIIMDNIFFKKSKNKTDTSITQTSTQIQSRPSFKAFISKQKSPTFTGKITENISKGIAKIIDNKKVQNFADKYKNKDKDIAKHISASTDILLTTSFAYQTNKSDKIKENRKKALIYNNVIGTIITLTMGYGIDNFIKNKTEKYLEKFKQVNISDAKVHKYIEGINILRPAIIFAGIYYGILPMISTYTAEKVDKFIEHQKNKNLKI